MPQDEKVKKLASALDRIGYRQPPRAAQWKKGQSGNPKGRPKLTSLAVTFRKLAAADVETSDGERLSGAGMELVLRKMFDKAVNKGNPDAARLLLALAKEYLPPDPGNECEANADETGAAPADAPVKADVS